MKTVIVYGDDSGTHDEAGNEKGSQFPTIAGFAAPPSEWSKFCVDWKAVLNSYGAPYFHFREWAAASAAIRLNKPDTPELKKNPYYGWDLPRLDKFLSTLARIAGSGNKVVLSGAIRLPAFHRFKAKLEVDKPEEIEFFDPYPYKYSMGEFFRIYHRETWRRWRDFKCPVSFFFDQSTDPKWRKAIFEVFDAFQKKDPRMAGISFADKKREPHLPLQAADLLAYRLNQISPKLAEINSCTDPSLLPALLKGFKFKNYDKYLLQNLFKSYGVDIP